MSDFTRIKQRTATYAEWEAQNNNTPGGLKILQGEVCIIIADQASAAAGLSNAIAQPGLQKDRLLPNTGEVLGMKMGQGSVQRWDEMSIYFPYSEINYGSGTGRLLGSRQNGGTHQYKTLNTALDAVFRPVYSGPEVGLTITSAGNNINGLLLKVGQTLPDVRLNAYPQARSYPIKRGRTLEQSRGGKQWGIDETAISPNTIGNFNRVVDDFRIAPNLGDTVLQGNGAYFRHFYADVTDTRPSNEGGEVTSQSGRVQVDATYPTFIGKSAAAIPSNPAALGAYLQANCTPMVRYKGRYDAGRVQFVNGERAIFGIPAIYGPLSDIIDELQLSQLGYPGAAFAPALSATVTEEGLFENVPYHFYHTETGFNAGIVFSYIQ